MVLGAGLVGSKIAEDLATQNKFEITVTDDRTASLGRLKGIQNIKSLKADLEDEEILRKVIHDQDLIIGALPGHMGFKTLQTVIQAGKDTVDISFFPEDAAQLDALAKENNVTAIYDAGIAPGLSNIILGHMSTRLDSITSFTCYVGGLPQKRILPWEYKAPFSPSDVIEEYTRPARIVEQGKIVTKPALSDPELVDFPEVGTLEAFNTDGLRSLIQSFPNIPNMVEKTLRYPGHVDKIKLLQKIGFFEPNNILVNGREVKPLEVTKSIILPQWELDENEEDLTVMRIVIQGKKGKKDANYTFNIVDYYDKKTNTLSMARTTGYVCTSIVNILDKKNFNTKGVIPPEKLGINKTCYTMIMKYLEERNININVQRT